MEGADLSGYLFDGIDIRQYDLKGAIIDHRALENHGLYDPTFYEKNLSLSIPDSDPGGKKSMLPIIYGQEDIYAEYLHKMEHPPDNVIAYVTDLHLDMKIKRAYPNAASIDEVCLFVKRSVKQLSNSINRAGLSFILVGGDVADSYDITRMFYHALSLEFSSIQVVAVLGNHELRDRSVGRTADEIADSYRKAMRDECGVPVLENDVLLFKGRRRKVVHEHGFDNVSDEVVHDFLKTFDVIVLGGVGYNGYRCVIGAEQGAYGGTLTDREGEVAQSRRFEALYNRLRSVASDLRVIVLTHMPVESWSDDPPVPSWIYVNGHTHQNKLEVNEEMTIYSDNQIGYGDRAMGLKLFLLCHNINPFEDASDGIHDVKVDDYREYCRWVGRGYDRRLKGPVTMLKRDGKYMFISENRDGGLHLLGGNTQLEKRPYQWYYDNMPSMLRDMKERMDAYSKLILPVSEMVKKMGGSGRVHGCIVDIDYLNHIFVNPFDGKVTPYWASSTVDKYAYPDLRSLLENEMPHLLGSYEKLASDVPMVPNNPVITKPVYYPDTGMYAYSKAIYKMQRTLERNEVCFWVEPSELRLKRADASVEGELSAGGREDKQ